MNSIIKELLSYLDLTSLNATDTIANINELVDFALATEKEGNPVAAICVYPNFGPHVLQRLEYSQIHTAVVAGSFPHGQSFLECKAQEVRIAAESGVHDIDIVLNRGLFLAGDVDGAANEIRVLKEQAGDAVLKVILETGELISPENIRIASRIAIESGADFIKTSTGKCTVGATEEAALIMCEEIKRAFENTGKQVGLKISGGVRTFDDAIAYREIIIKTLGNNWLTPKLFRIGASSLAHELVKRVG
jgi:deoxyribose-phosphate aldolase